MKTRSFQTDYPYELKPRYGFGAPLYGPMEQAFLARQAALDSFADDIIDVAPALAAIPVDEERDSLSPFWRNDWFGPLDAAALMTAIRRWQPKKYVEIGSGCSTRFARRAFEQFGVGGQIISLDPQPRHEVDALCDRVIRAPLEEYDGGVFTTLQAGDILFFDGSHRCFQNSDVTVFFMEVLPALASGVHVQIHDIFWPEDYQASWSDKVYNEQYLLAMLFQHADPEWQIEFGCRYVRHNASMQAKFQLIKPALDHTGIYPAGGSFWMTKG